MEMTATVNIRYRGVNMYPLAIPKLAKAKKAPLNTAKTNIITKT